MTIGSIKTKWNKEKNFYKKQEIGSGVQSFVKLCLENQELFNLANGNLAKKAELRKNEFIYEKTAKEGRHADFVIYINSEIIIPIEVELFENIRAGIKQIFNYQKDFDKHYGILTDGFVWRFYDNNVYREFNLNQILEETEVFLEFWKEYIKPESYYLTFFEPHGQLSLLKEDKLPVEENRQIFFEDITRLIKSFKNKLIAEGYFQELEKKEKDRKAVELTYAYVIQFILYKTLVDNEFSQFHNEFAETVKSIHSCLKVKQYGKILGIIEGISNNISKNIYRPFKKEQEFINQILLDLIRKPHNELHEVSLWLDIFVFIKKYNFANIQNEIFGYIYENYLKELYEEGKKGQYFTDPAVVNFMLEQVGYTPENLIKRFNYDKDSISLIDPSCGSGTFLYSAVNSIVKAFGNHDREKSEKVEEIVNQNIFGLDIAEFPLYLAEMNILMRMLHLIINEKYNNPIDKKIKVFLTKDSVSEFINSGLKNTINDIDVMRGQQMLFSEEKLDFEFKSFMREKDDLEEMKQSMQRLPRRRFDFVIGNPPYISYNECSKQGVLIFELMKQGKVKLSNIYGINLHSIPERQKKYSPKPNLYVFFIALGISLLKDNGKLCFIIPQTVLVNNDFDVIRYHLAKFTTIEKIITFSGKMFVGRGFKQNKPISTSSLIFILTKAIPDTLRKVEVINYLNSSDSVDECLENIMVNRKISQKQILQMELLRNISNWNFIKQKKEFIDFFQEYKNSSEGISLYYNHVSAKINFNSNFYFDGSVNIPKKDIIKGNIENKNEYYSIPSLKSQSYVSGIDGFYPKNKKIKIAEGSQGLIIANCKYKILWRYINHNHFYFFQENNALPIYQQYCIASNNREEIFYLFSLLNSNTVSEILIKLLKIEQEDKLSFILGLTSIKEFVRVPKINEFNQPIKNEVIKQTEKMLMLEDKTLSDFVDFSKVMVQKFDNVSVENDFLILSNDDENNKFRMKENANLIKKTIDEHFNNQELKFKSQKIDLSELKTLPVIDFEKQKKLKNYIDDLVFALYFNISLIKIGEVDLSKKDVIKKACAENKFYKLIEESATTK